MSQIPEYIQDWITIIEEMVNDNTYKLAWGRAIIECARDKKDNNTIIKYDNISECMLKYYWNQLFFFNLKQAPYKDKEPYICQYTKELIERYIELKQSKNPCWFEDARIFFDKNDKAFYDKIIKKISKVLPTNVAYRFLHVNKSEENPNGCLKVYRFEKGLDYIEFNYDELELLRDYDVIISKLLNYKWAQLLEKFNYSPRIASKVNGISQAKEVGKSALRRKNLQKYKEALLKEFEGIDPVDFYTGEDLKGKEITVDHVIPWSFMYSDDIWNLVLTSKSNNSSKSNRTPSEAEIEKLKKRNERLKDLLDDRLKGDLELAIKEDLVSKYYFSCKVQ